VARVLLERVKELEAKQGKYVHVGTIEETTMKWDVPYSTNYQGKLVFMYGIEKPFGFGVGSFDQADLMK